MIKIKYKLIIEGPSNEFETEIEKCLDSGWELYGSPGFNGLYWFQAVILKVKKYE